MLIFAFVRRNRVILCEQNVPGEIIQGVTEFCIQQSQGFLLAAFVFLVLFVVFFIFGLFEKSSKRR